MTKFRCRLLISANSSCVAGSMSGFSLVIVFMWFSLHTTCASEAAFQERYDVVAAPAPAPALLFPSSPIYPVLPNGPLPQQMPELCGLDISSIKEMLIKTAGDCTAPLAEYVGNVICCPQFSSMLHIFKGEWSFASGSLVLGHRQAAQCFPNILSVLVENGANTSITSLCNVRPINLTGGLCPVTSLKKFEQIVDTSKLLTACATVDPLKECCNAICQPAIADAAIRLASSSDQSAGTLNLVDDCEGVVYAWLARQLGPETSNSAFRILSNCKVNQVCPLTFKNVSSVAKACGGKYPSRSKCCNSLSAYISTLQQQMLITNVQALECVTLFASMLKKEGVIIDVYNICQVDLKDFSLQVYGQQGCLLRSIPSDIVYDNVSGISFTCDLNDNIPAPWPLSSSLSSFPLCANRNTLPALPVLQTSGSPRRRMLDLSGVLSTFMFLMAWSLKAFGAHVFGACNILNG